MTQESTHFLVLLVSCPIEKAPALARTLVDEKLAACVNIQGPVRSIYAWKGRISDEKEGLLFIKSKAPILDDLMRRIKELHPYEVPEIIAIPIIKGSKDYFKWLSDETLRR